MPFAKPLQADYLPAALTSKDYPFWFIGPGDSVETIAVGAVLIAYNWPRDSDRYRRINKFVERFFPAARRIPKAAASSEMGGDQFGGYGAGLNPVPAAEEWLQRNNATAQAASQREQFERFLETRPQAYNKAISPSERERLFQSF